MKIEILGPATYTRSPWRNRGGFTTELIASIDSGDDTMVWRLSIADVDSDGPFSNFDGYDRTLILTKGKGITLDHDKNRTDRLTERFESASFGGELTTYATLHDGSIQDFNIISLRDRCTTKVAVIKGSDSATVDVGADILLAFATDNSSLVTPPIGGTVTLERNHLLSADDFAHGKWKFEGSPVIVTQIYVD